MDRSCAAILPKNRRPLQHYGTELNLTVWHEHHDLIGETTRKEKSGIDGSPRKIPKVDPQKSLIVVVDEIVVLFAQENDP